MSQKISQLYPFHTLVYSFFIIASLKVASILAAVEVPCEFCCPHLFSTFKGIINVRENPSWFHSVSYIIRCLMSTDEVVIVTDASSTHPFWLNWNRYQQDESTGRLCTHAENVLLSHVRATDFLGANPGYLHRVIPTIDPGRATSFAAATARRTNFIFISDSQEQMISLISKVEQELQTLRTGRRFFWQPYIIFMWSKVQNFFRNTENTENVNNNDDVAEGTMLESWLGKFQPYFTIDSGIFFFFMVQKGNSTRSRMNLFLSMWECYKLKGKFFLQKVKERPNARFERISEEKCNNSVRRASPMLSWMEKINSYIFIERFSRRDNFGLLPITSSLVPTQTNDWVVYKRTENGSVKLESGNPAGIYEGFQIMMNFSDDIQIGDLVQYRNDSQLNADKADILLNPRSVTPARGYYYSFLQPTIFGIYEAFFRQPSADSIRNIVSAPFKIDLWAVIIIIWLLIIGCLYGWGYAAKKNYLCTGDDEEFFQGIGVWAIAVLSQKSWYTSPSSFNFKAIYYITSLTALVCYAAYSAMIVSFLTVKVVPIQTLNDLTTYNYKFTVHESSEATVSLLEEMITTNKLAQTVIKINTENEITHLIERKKALLSYPDLFYGTAFQQNYSEYFICTNIYSLPVGNTPYKSAMSVRKGSQYREIFSEKLLILIERGLNHRYKKAYDNNRPINCPKKGYDGAKAVLDPVRLTDVFTTFLVIFLGWFSAVWVFCTERLFKRRSTLYDMIFLLQ